MPRSNSTRNSSLLIGSTASREQELSRHYEGWRHLQRQRDELNVFAWIILVLDRRAASDFKHGTQVFGVRNALSTIDGGERRGLAARFA
jgi:hypothetical protein